MSRGNDSCRMFVVKGWYTFVLRKVFTSFSWFFFKSFNYYTKDVSSDTYFEKYENKFFFPFPTTDETRLKLLSCEIEIKMNVLCIKMNFVKK